jgi:hypothetical protein
MSPSLNPYYNRPRRVSEIWKLNRNTGEVIALATEGLVRFNPLASAIWLMLDGQNTITSIIENITTAYPDNDILSIDSDVMSFVDYLVNHRLIVLNWSPL